MENINVFEEWISLLNKRMIRENRNILMFLGNSATHYHHNQASLTNIKIVFFPPNATSVLQPCDQGIILNFNVHYRKLMTRKIISESDKENGNHINLAKQISFMTQLK